MLLINGWKSLTIVKKNLYMNVYIVSIHINVELLSNVDKINTPTSKNSDAIFKNYDCSSILWVSQSRNGISDRWCIIHTFLLISIPDTHYKILKLLFFFSFSYLSLLFLYFLLLLHQFLGISGNLDQHIIFLASKQQ